MIARLSSRRQFVIPKSIASAMCLKPGDMLNVVKEKNTIVLIPVEIVERKVAKSKKGDKHADL